MALLSEWVSLSYGFGALLAGLIWGRIEVDMHKAEEVVQTLSSLFGSELFLVLSGFCFFFLEWQ